MKAFKLGFKVALLRKKNSTTMSLNNCQLAVLLLLLLGFTHHQVTGICDVDICATNPEKCVLSKDKSTCKCVEGFYDDHCDKDAHIKVLCTKTYMGVRAREEFFIYYNTPVTSLHLPNKSCKAYREVVNKIPYYMIKIAKNEYIGCGGQSLEKNFTHVTYTMSLQSEPQVFGNIIRDPVIKLDFTCIYPFIRTVSLPFPIQPISSEAMVRVDELDAIIRMMLYTDHSYTTPFSSAPTIELGDQVYVEIAVTEPADFFLLRINDCWATQSQHPNASEGLVHSLLLNGCATDDTVGFHSLNEQASGLNGQSSTIHYSFAMFRFTVEPHLFYLHCTVQLCDPDDSTSCTPNCKSITKREAVRVDSAQGLLSYGPIRIETPDKPLSNVVTTVVLPVAGVWAVAFILTLLIAVARAASRKVVQTDQLSFQ
ncbi:zona pellucida glycoprotein d [Syngnathus typhle]|uniref:zona pellucida glycoprotein d n=1 Tax=Syngnathus typhle TaxID=161592 RepID=UPI002A69FAEE|nr:zona pellucida glycoprotein d [Syngnathus typhle]